MRREYFAAIVASFSTACALSMPELQSPYGTARVTPEAEAFAPSAPAIYLEQSTYVTHTEGMGAGTAYEYYSALWVRDPEGLEYAVAHFPVPNNGEILRLEARTVLPSGEVVPLLETDIIEHEVFRPAGNQSEPTRLRSFAFPRATVGSVLEARWVVVRPGAWSTEFRHALNGEIPVLRSSFEIRPAPMIALEYQSVAFRRDEASAVARFQNDGYAGPPRVVSAPREGEWIPQVGLAGTGVGGLMGGTGKWSQIADRLWGLFIHDAREPLPDLALEPLSPQLKVARIWAFVQNEIEDREGLVESDDGWTLEKIVQNRQGTAGERGRLLLALLVRAGIDAFPLVVQPSWHPPITGEFQYAGVLSGDWLAWVESDGKAFVLDPACLGCAAGEIAAEHQGLTAIRFELGAPTQDSRSIFTTLGSTRVELTDLPAGAAARRPWRYEATIARGPDGLVMQKGMASISGPHAGAIRHQLQRLGRLRGDERLREWMGLADTGGRVFAESTEPSLEPLVLRAEDAPLLRARVVDAEGLFSFTLSTLARERWLHASTRPRTVDIFLGTRAPFERILKVEAPAGCGWRPLPQAVNIESGFITYAFSAELDGTTVIAKESFVFPAERVPLADHAKWIEQVERIERARAEPFVCR